MDSRRLYRINLTAADKDALVSELDLVLQSLNYSDSRFKPLYTAWLKLSESKPYKS